MVLSSKIEGHLRLIGKVERRGSKLALGLGGVNAKGKGVARNDRGQVLIFLSIVAAKVSLDDGDGLFVNVVVLVLLKALDVIDAAGLINERNISCNLVEGLASLEDGLERLEGNGNNLGIGAVHDATDGLDGTCLDETLNMLGGTTSANIGDDPSRLLSHFPLIVVQGIDDGRNETSAVDDGTNLDMSSSGNVGKEPAGFLANILASVTEQRLHHSQHVGIDDSLGLSVTSAHKVAESTKARGDKVGLIRAEKLNKSVGNIGILAGLDALVISITKVAESPSDVDHDITGSRGVAQKRGKVGKGRRHHVQIWLRLATAQVGKSPNDVAEESRAGRLGNVEKNALHGTRLKHGVAKSGRVAGNVAKAPGALLTDVGITGSKLSDEVGDGAGIGNGNGAVRIGGSDVGQSPGSLELDFGIVTCEETDEVGQGAALDHILAGRVALHGKQSTEGTDALEDGRVIDVAVGCDAGVELRNIGDGVDLAVGRRSGRGRGRTGGSGGVHGGRSGSGTDSTGAHGPSLHEAVLLLRLAKLNSGIVTTTTAGIGGNAHLEGSRTVCTIGRK